MEYLGQRAVTDGTMDPGTPVKDAADSSSTSQPPTSDVDFRPIRSEGFSNSKPLCHGVSGQWL